MWTNNSPELPATFAVLPDLAWPPLGLECATAAGRADPNLHSAISEEDGAMGEVVQLFPKEPTDLQTGELVWLPQYGSFGSIVDIRSSGRVEIAMQGRSVALHAVRNRHEICTAREEAFRRATEQVTGS